MLVISIDGEKAQKMRVNRILVHGAQVWDSMHGSAKQVWKVMWCMRGLKVAEI